MGSDTKNTSARARLVTDLAPARWLEQGVGEWEMPEVFEAYARVLHPALDQSERYVQWAEVAEWAGRDLHARSDFEEISAPGPEGGTGARPWEEPPNAGSFPLDVLPQLGEVLARHTKTPERCWFCLWDGFGWLDDEDDQTSSIVVAASEGDEPAPGPDQDRLRLTFEGRLRDAPLIHLPTRDYYLLTGPLEAAYGLGAATESYFFFPQSPNLFWPDDRAWCVATDIDLDSTYVGGSAELIRELVAGERLEAFTIEAG
ncbi:hypothetical protein [Actinomadura rudentiformis]|uniref:Uncharacterized protein n=1 Tax=Actinomadura rudentiformis TaxID=359158 RepID=A0A6H9Z4B4_9ACTN|nr:hypothetical protein [Actinomadura rudentiformis]KAB2349479.1 hypothetical protein F8566_11885 [Actinomadura rudentiformis]